MITILLHVDFIGSRYLYNVCFKFSSKTAILYAHVYTVCDFQNRLILNERYD